MCAAAAARLLVGPRSTAVAARGVILTDELMVRRGGELAEQQLLTGLSALSLSLQLPLPGLQSAPDNKQE